LICADSYVVPLLNVKRKTHRHCTFYHAKSHLSTLLLVLIGVCICQAKVGNFITKLKMMFEGTGALLYSIKLAKDREITVYG